MTDWKILLLEIIKEYSKKADGSCESSALLVAL